VDNCIIIGDTFDCINKLIQSLQDGDEKFVGQDEGSMSDEGSGTVVLLVPLFKATMALPWPLVALLNFVMMDMLPKIS
jgi:hypothetical protein